MTQYLTAKFRKDDRRSYTYANEGDPVKPGDEIKVPDKSGDGWTRATVFGLLSDAEAEALPYKLKAIIGKVDDTAPQLDLKGD